MLPSNKIFIKIHKKCCLVTKSGVKSKLFR
nr:MAG TPA: hypothetical protein [Caudoviricetes sp.]